MTIPFANTEVMITVVFINMNKTLLVVSVSRRASLKQAILVYRDISHKTFYCLFGLKTFQMSVLILMSVTKTLL